MARGQAIAAVSQDPVAGSWALPPGWRWERLGDLGAWLGGGTPPKSNPAFWTGGDIPWVSPKDMKRPVITATEDHITAAAVAGSTTKIVPAGAVLCVMRSGILRHSFPVAVNAVAVTLNQDMRALRVRDDVDPYYLAHYLRASAQTVLERCVKGGTTVSSVEAARLDRHIVPVPPTDVQRRIVARINELFAEIEDGESGLAQARKDLDAYRDSLLGAAVAGELTADWRAANPPTQTGTELLNRILADRRVHWEVHPRNAGKRFVEPAGPITDRLPELPFGWAWASMAQLVELVTSGSRGWGDYYADDGALFIRAQNIKTDRLVLDDIAFVRLPTRTEGLRTRVKLHDILVTITGANVTKSALVTQELEEAYVSQHVALVRPAKLLHSPYIYWWVVTPSAGRGMLERVAYGAGKPGLNLGNITNMPVALPPLAEQEAISQILAAEMRNAEPLAELCTNVTGDMLRQSILAAAFRGELVA